MADPSKLQEEAGLREVSSMTHEEMARHQRFDLVGSKFFKGGTPLSDAFTKRFESLGGMTTEISKKIGFDR